MAFTRVTFENPHNGHIRIAPIGFSWTVLFFGFLPPLFRSDWKWGIIIFLFAFFTWEISNIIFSFIYNKLYVKDLIGNGYKARSAQIGSVEQVSERINVRIPQFEIA